MKKVTEEEFIKCYQDKKYLTVTEFAERESYQKAWIYAKLRKKNQITKVIYTERVKIIREYLIETGGKLVNLPRGPKKRSERFRPQNKERGV